MLLSFVLIFSTLPAFAQADDAKKELSAREIELEREARKFMTGVWLELAEKQDVSKLSAEFFVSNYDDLRGINDLATAKEFAPSVDNMRPEDLARFTTAMQNVMVLARMRSLVEKRDDGNESDEEDEEDDEEDEEDDEDEDDDSMLMKVFGPGAVAVIKANRLLVESDDNKDDQSPISPAQLLSVAETFEEVTRLMRVDLGNRDAKWKDRYAAAVASMMAESNSLNISKCSGGECAGLPEDTEIVYTGSSLICFDLTIENGKLKIYRIHVQLEN